MIETWRRGILNRMTIKRVVFPLVAMCAVEKRRLALRVSLALLATIVGLGAGCGRREESSPADLIKTLKDHKEPDMRAWAARELGRLTTVAVVQAIFLVILADALFAILFVKLDI